jgi:23S rRNA (cytidine1920-2'-O)/16S rRNA (cytidine1409-2'-O)-methyltransferase
VKLKRPKQSTVIDELLRRAMVPSRDKGVAYILGGHVQHGSSRAEKPGDPCSPEDSLTLKLPTEDVGRGAQKLDGALGTFRWEVKDRVAADVGSSTGGFTQVLLRNGAKRVFAIDVGYGELAWELRSDPRVTVMERTNARTLLALPEQITRATVDLSFISLRQVLPQIRLWGEEELQICALVKPQFEAPPETVPSGGVIVDPQVHATILREIMQWCVAEGFLLLGLCPSPLKGRDGNQEYFLLLGNRGVGQSPEVLLKAVGFND